MIGIVIKMNEKSDKFIFFSILVIVFIIIVSSINVLFKEQNEMLDELTAAQNKMMKKAKEEYSLEGYIKGKSMIQGTNSTSTNLIVMGTMIMPMTSYDYSPDKYYIEINDKKFKISKKEWDLVTEGDNVKIIYDGLHTIKSIINNS